MKNRRYCTLDSVDRGTKVGFKMKPLGWKEFSASNQNEHQIFSKLSDQLQENNGTFCLQLKTMKFSLFSSLWQLWCTTEIPSNLVPTFLLSALAWTQRRMKIVTLLFENQTKWMNKIKRISMLAEVRNEKMWFISIQLFFSLKRDLFKKLVQKSHNFSEIRKNLSFH